MSKKGKRVLIIIGVILLIWIGLKIGNEIWYRHWVREQQKVDVVPRKISFRSIGREKDHYLFMVEAGKIQRIDITKMYQIIRASGISDRYKPFDYDISPDGEKIVFSSRMGGEVDNLYLVDRDGSNLRQLTHFSRQEFWFAHYPRFSPDGEKIVFTAPKPCEKGDSPPGVYLVDVDGTEVKELTGEQHWGGTDPSWSHSGREIVFVSNEKGDTPPHYNLFIMDSEGKEIRRLTREKYTQRKPCFSPDDTMICFQGLTRGERAGSEIFAVRADGSGREMRITPAKEYYRYPYWATDSYPDWGE